MLNLDELRLGLDELHDLGKKLAADHGHAGLRANLCGAIVRLAARWRDRIDAHKHEAASAAHAAAAFDPARDIDYVPIESEGAPDPVERPAGAYTAGDGPAPDDRGDTAIPKA